MSYSLRFAFIGVGVLAVLGACGGSVTVDQGATSGGPGGSHATGVTGVGGTAFSEVGVGFAATGTTFASTGAFSVATSVGVTTTTTGAGGSPSCPPSPTPGKPCSSPGQLCSYGYCCPEFLECLNGKWTLGNTDCPAPAACPPTAPADGDPCSQCFQQSPCQYMCPGSGVITAQCAGEQWYVKNTCPTGVTCGGAVCKAGEVCVETLFGAASMKFACAPDPCSPSPLSCSCAASLCKSGGSGLTCGSAQNGTVFCDCPTCG